MFKVDNDLFHDSAMMEKRQMTVEDFLAIMDANKETFPDFATLPKEAKIMVANVNICTGTAYSYYKEGKFWGVGGIRYTGLGEAWLIGMPETRKELIMPEFYFIKDEFRRQRDELNLWRIFAENRISEDFLRHLGFEKKDNILVWTRK